MEHQTSSPLADGDAEQREAEYARIEQQIAAAGAPGDQESAVALVVASVRPLIEHVLCAASSRIATEEWTRASVLLYEMIKVDMLKVCAEFNRKTEEGIPLHMTIFTAPDSVFATMVEKEPSAWTRDDAVIAGVQMAPYGAMWTRGASEIFAMAEWGEVEWFGAWAGSCMPYFPRGLPKAAAGRASRRIDSRRWRYCAWTSCGRRRTRCRKRWSRARGLPSAT